MWTYFWAGLLAGLIIWAVAEAALRLRRPVSKGMREEVFAVLALTKPSADLAYTLRRIKADFSGCGFTGCRILLADRELSENDRQVAARTEGVYLVPSRVLEILPWRTE